VPAAVVLALLTAGCGAAVRVPLKPFYVPADLAPEQGEVRLNVPYRTDETADPAKHRLDLYLPRRPGWPLLIFVHGGSLEKGDSARSLGGNDIYRNIGRFWAARGVGVALVNYRLQPDVTWPSQVEDAAAATGWLLQRAGELGCDGRVFLSGHSAGAWIASRVVLDRAVRDRHGIGPGDIDGMISISGSGFDLTDEQTWEMFGRERIWQRRFSVHANDTEWKKRASVLPLVEAGAPPFLLLYSSEEWPALARQNRLFCEALREVGARCEIEAIEGLGHRRTLLALSRDNGTMTDRIREALGAAGTAVGAGALTREAAPDAAH